MSEPVDLELAAHAERTRAATQLGEVLKQVWLDPIEVYVGKTSVRFMCRQLDRDKWLSVIGSFLKAEDANGGWSSEICERYMLTATETGKKLIRAWQLRFQSEDLVGTLHLVSGALLAVKPVPGNKKQPPPGGVVDFTVVTPPNGGPPTENADYAPAIRRRAGYRDPKGAGGWALSDATMGPKQR